MNRESKLVLFLAIVVIAVATLAFGAPSSRAHPALHEAAEAPHALPHAKTLADIFPRGR